MTVVVTLTLPELYLAGTVAIMRVISNLRDKREPRYGAPANGDGCFEFHWLGCCGEVAAAKHLNLFWSGALGNFKATDVGGKFQVRTAAKVCHKLIVHPADEGERPFILALAHDLPRVTLRGWLYAEEAKRQCYYIDPTGKGRHAFFVPQEDLRAIDDLTNIADDEV